MSTNLKQGKRLSSEQKSWYQDRYLISIIQRNFLILICLFILIALITSLLTIKSMIERNSVEPYIFKVSEHDGIPVSLNVDSVKEYTDTNQPVVEYFLSRYINARESYNPHMYSYNYGTIVKSMSERKIYRSFYEAKIKDETTSPVKTLGNIGRADVIIKEITSIPKKKMATFRIALKTKKRNSIHSVKNYKIILHYKFAPEDSSYKDITINPLGLKVDAYDVFEERSINK